MAEPPIAGAPHSHPPGPGLCPPSRGRPATAQGRMEDADTGPPQPTSQEREREAGSEAKRPQAVVCHPQNGLFGEEKLT